MSNTNPLALLDDAEREQARAASLYVTTRFYPPLPAEYGAAAVVALREYREHGDLGRVNLPRDLNPLPAEAMVDSDGDVFVFATDLIRILRIEHMLDDDEEPEPEESDERHYAIGVPLCVTVAADGTVSIDVDLSEVDITEDDDAWGRYGSATASSDHETVQRAAEALLHVISTKIKA